MASKPRLDQCIHAFAGDLLSFVQRAGDSIHALKRTVEQRPAAGVQDFKECLDDLEQQVAEFTDEIQQLECCTSETTSLEELIGHCTAVYNSNRVASLALEAHLTQYGYQQPTGTVQEPENLNDVVLDVSGGGAGPAVAYLNMTGCGSMPRAHSTPTSPVSKLSFGALTSVQMPSRLGMSQPGSPVARCRAPAAIRLWGQAPALSGTAGQPGYACVDAVPGSVAPHSQHQQHERASFGTTSLTPPGLLISPGVAALASKYATSSVGGSSVGGISWSGCQPSAGLTAKHAACWDLSLSYSVPDTNSPSLPVFGTASSQQQTSTTGAPDGTAACDVNTAAATSDQITPDATGQKASSVNNGEDTTGQLYSSIIHSNFNAASSRDVDMQDDQATEPVTPPATSCPGTPKAPATAGRLPAEWHSQKMQELNNLQADLTVTFSQMKRTPSRSRLAHLAVEDEDKEQGNKPTKQHIQQHQAHDSGQHIVGDGALQRDRYVEASAADGVDVHAGDDFGTEQQPPLSANLQLLRQRLQEQRRKEQQPQQQQHSTALPHPATLMAEVAAGACGDDHTCSGHSACQPTAAAAASAAVSAAAAAAAAATADLERWMQSLSKKYAAQQALNASAGAATATRSEELQPMLHGREHTISPDADALSDVVDDSEGLIIKYAALAVDTAANTMQPMTDDNPGLLPPVLSCSPKQELQHPGAAAALLHSSAGAATAAAAAAAARTSALVCSVASDMSAISDGTPGKPRLAAALAAGMAAFHSALRMDCPSPLSPDSPGNVRFGSSSMNNASEVTPAASALATWPETTAPEVERAAALATPEGQESEPANLTVETVATAVAAIAGVDDSGDVGATRQPERHQSVLTPATQQAIKDAVAAVGIDSARPKSSIRRLQPTTDMKRLQNMRGYWQSLQQPQLQQHAPPQQQQQQQGLVMNLEERLAGAATDNAGHLSQSPANQRTTMQASRLQQEPDQQASEPPGAVHSLRGGSSGNSSARESKQVPGLDLSLVQQQQLTPRAARPLRRQQQQQGRTASGSAARPASVLRSVENLTHGSATATSGPGSASKGSVASPAAAARCSPATSTDSGNACKLRASPAASTTVLVKAKPVTEDEFSRLPRWCRGLLTVDVLNTALEELAGLAASRVGKRSMMGCEGFTASDLEMLGHSSSKSKTIVSCLHKLNRATLQRSAAGSNVYKLLGTPVN